MRAFDVSRETVERLELYEQLLIKWQKVQNLVAPNTLGQIWHRHFADSAQLLPYLFTDNEREKVPGDSKTIVDLGSGAGFPGLVLAILLMDRPGFQVHLVEANARKCAFLKDVTRQTGVHVEIHNCRIEVFAIESTIPIIDVVTARALKPLDQLVSLGQFAFETGATGLFLKGKTATDEIEAAKKGWSFKTECFESQTDPLGRIVRIFDVKPRL